MLLLAFSFSAFFVTNAQAFTLEVVDGDGNPITNYRWMIQEDTTFDITAGDETTGKTLGVNFHKSYAPVVANGTLKTDLSNGQVLINDPLPGEMGYEGQPLDLDNKRYFISVLPDGLPDAGHTMSGGPITAELLAENDNANKIKVVLYKHPVPTAQISVLVFRDNNPTNNAPDFPAEKPNPADPDTHMANFKIVLEDAGGRYGISAGTQMADAFGNPLGTVYDDRNGDVIKLGDGVITTDENGLAVIKNLAPGKYGVTVVPPVMDPGFEWHQTSTIEGKKVVDAWVKADEPAFFVEFGPPGFHVFTGFVQKLKNTDPGALDGNITLTGKIVSKHNSRPPEFAFFEGAPVGDCFVALNDGAAGTGKAIYIQPCGGVGQDGMDLEDHEFEIPNVPPGKYDLGIWDGNLDYIFATLPVCVEGTDNQGNVTVCKPTDPQIIGNEIDLQNISVFAWFARFEGMVFNDVDGDGFRDPGELPMPEEGINLRFRDGTVYQGFPTDLGGEAPFEETFPFFHWLVAEVGFGRYQATGATFIVDNGGEITPDDGWNNPTGGVLNPQLQFEADGITPVDNPNTGNNKSRTVKGEVLTQGFQAFLGQTIRAEFGKRPYTVDENGNPENGRISGVVIYATTRAEDNPALAAAEPWEPGVPRVQVSLYEDADHDGIIDDKDGSGDVTAADVDNYPFAWSDPNHPDFPTKGDEDEDHNGNGTFDMGDAVQVTHSDSWDDDLPTGCQGEVYEWNGEPRDCYDGLRNFNQARPAVFDGGYAFEGPLATDCYIVEAVLPPGYELVKEESKNVDFGNVYNWEADPLDPNDPGGSTMIPSPSPIDGGAVCVGKEHLVPDHLTLFSAHEIPAPYAGQMRKLCDRKQVVLGGQTNAAADFFVFTEVPIAGHIVGIILNDLANEFDPTKPTFGEKAAGAFLPISIRDWKGHLIAWTVSDATGAYNALVPSTYTANLPQPSGMSPSMITVVLNDDGHPSVDADPRFSQFTYTFNYMPGTTTYLDTPVVPIAAFVGPKQFPLDCEFGHETPVIAEVSTNGGMDGPFIPAGGNTTLTIKSPDPLLTMTGDVQVPNPAYDGTNERKITRNYGFGTVPGTVTIGGVVVNNNLSWTATSITVDVPAGTPTGQLVVTRGDNNKSSVLGVTVTVDDPAKPMNVYKVGPNRALKTIQEGLDAVVVDPNTTGRNLVLVDPGTYNELVFMTKPVQLQGWGAYATTINAAQSPANKIKDWRADVNLRWAKAEFDFLPGQFQAQLEGAEGIEPLLFRAEGAGISVFAKDVPESQGAFGPDSSPRIDGFTVRGASTGGGIFVNGYAHNLEISNNWVTLNSGFAGGGIRIGHPDLLLQTPEGQNHQNAENDHIRIHNNKITSNGALSGAGAGISLYTGADDYEVTRNYICGNFTLGSTNGGGAGIGHLGRSERATIADNYILFNQSFNQGLPAVNGGGLFIGGAELPGQDSPGSGSVTVNNNLIQGNQAGAGDGGGIHAQSNLPKDAITISNNIIVNNVAGRGGGGLSVIASPGDTDNDPTDTANIDIIHCTIAHNDSTATTGVSFTTPILSASEPAGIVSRAATDGVATNPQMDSNIFWENRSFHFEIDPNVSPTPGNPGYGLVPDIGAGEDPVFRDMDVPLTSTKSVCTDIPENMSNCPGGTLNNPMFVTGYFNGGAGQTVIEIEGVTINTAIAFDEGGNFIDVHFSPLSINVDLLALGGVQASDYHIKSGSSAIGQGMIDGTLTPTDFDGDVNIDGTGVIVGAYAGADRYTAPPATPNLAPFAVNDSYFIDGGSREVQEEIDGLLANDYDPDGDALTAPILVKLPSHGIIKDFNKDNKKGTFKYEKDGTFVDTDTFSYLVTDGTLGSVATVTIRQANTSDTGNPPVATADPINISPNTTGYTRVLPNDPDFNDTHTYEIIAVPANGMVTNMDMNGFVPGGTVEYTPDENYIGGDSLTVRVTDSTGLFDEVTVNIDVSLTLPDTQMVQIQIPLDEQVEIDPDTGALALVDSDGDGIANNDNVHWLLGAGDGFSVMADGKAQYGFSYMNLNHLIPELRDASGAPLPDLPANAVHEIPMDKIIQAGMLKGEFAAPTITVKQGQKLYLNLVNVGMAIRPDLFDPHTVHFHGFPNASAVFDGVPDSSIAVNMMGVLTYYYNIVEEGTYMYHCHVEATEHMQMGMLGNLYVLPKQNELPNQTFSNGFMHTKGNTYAYNDGDGSTYYDVDVPIQMGSFDSVFHDASEAVQPLPFADMKDDYAMINGRGYPDTVNPRHLKPVEQNIVVETNTDPSDPDPVAVAVAATPPGAPVISGDAQRRFYVEGTSLLEIADKYNELDLYFTKGANNAGNAELSGRIQEYNLVKDGAGNVIPGVMEVVLANDPENNPILPNVPAVGDEFVIGRVSQRINSIVEVEQGKKVLLRISNLNVTRFYTLASTIPMRVVGKDAKLLRGPEVSLFGGMFVIKGKDLSYTTNSVTLGGGESTDAILDTADVAPGTYLLYTTNLNYLTNGTEDFGGMMTEIKITAPPMTP